MATTVDFIEFVCEQIKGAWDIRYKKMFGEYMVYVNDKPRKKKLKQEIDNGCKK